MEPGGVVVLRERPASWARVWIPLLAVVLLLGFGIVVLAIDREADWVQVVTRVTLGVEGVALVGVAVVGLRTRVELHPDELRVVGGLRAVRVPWAEITDVHGDVRRRLDWSTRLVVEAGTRTIMLPHLGRDLAALRDVILARVPAQDSPPPAPVADRPRHQLPTRGQ